MRLFLCSFIFLIGCVRSTANTVCVQGFLFNLFSQKKFNSFCAVSLFLHPPPSESLKLFLNYFQRHAHIWILSLVVSILCNSRENVETPRKMAQPQQISLGRNCSTRTRVKLIYSFRFAGTLCPYSATTISSQLASLSTLKNLSKHRGRLMSGNLKDDKIV